MMKKQIFMTSYTMAGMMMLAAATFSPAAHSEAKHERFDQRSTPSTTQNAAYAGSAEQNGIETYSPQEIVDAGHGFFGKTTRGLANVVDHSFGMAGAPSGYIIGEEASGAFFGGLRYGEGMLHMKDGTRQKVYWQGPSMGFDIGGNGSRALVLVYHMTHPDQIYQRYGGIEGTAYFVGGAGINFQRSADLMLAPIRTGLGARLGANIGYLKYTREPTWNPF